MGKKELQRYSLRKSSLGAASVLLGTAVLAVGASNASADEVATSTDSVTPAVEATDAVEESTSAVADSTEKKVVNVTEEGNTTVTTSEVTNTSLEAAKTAATNEGVEVRKNLLKPKKLLAAAADNKAQQRKSIQSFLIISG
ncbi:MAG: YSIRK-type signal peptide-containing protein [Streptococcus salivarius]